MAEPEPHPTVTIRMLAKRENLDRVDPQRSTGKETVPICDSPEVRRAGESTLWDLLFPCNVCSIQPGLGASWTAGLDAQFLSGVLTGATVSPPRTESFLLDFTLAFHQSTFESLANKFFRGGYLYLW